MMVLYYIKIAIANLKQSKVYSIISIFSLTIGMAACLLLMIYVSDELSFDRFHDKADQIYRLCQVESPYQSPLTAQYLTDHLPVIKKYTRILPLDNVIVEWEDKRFIENETAFVDPEFFRLFSFRFENGQAETALDQPATLVISEKIAQKYFGHENPVGKILKIQNNKEYTITGVVKDLPGNSHFQFDFFITLADANAVFGEDLMNNWRWHNFLVYFELQDGFSQPELEVMVSKLMKESNEDTEPGDKYTLQSLKDIHLYSSHFKNDIQPQNSITYILLFSGIGLLILLIACFNYINLLIANATTRMTEIGVRKTFGSSRNQLAKLFLTESILMLLVSTGLSLAVVETIMPAFNSLSGKELSFLSLVNRNNLSGILGMMLIVMLLAGWYPAYILTSSRPNTIMKTIKYSGGSELGFQKILLGIQFTIVIALIACSIVMLRQISFLQHTDLGFNKESVVVSKLYFGEQEKFNTLKQRLLTQSLVSSVSAASRIPTGNLSNTGQVTPEGQKEPVAIPYVHVQFDYFETLGIKAARGRLFSSEIQTDATESVILNNAAVQALQLKGDPLGQKLYCNWPNSNRTIVGVIDDVYFEPLYEFIKPTVFVIHLDPCFQLIVKTESANPSETINALTKICLEVYPNEIVDFQFLDSKLERLYEKDQKNFHLMGSFAILSILLACIGLMGMTSFVLIRSTKEIGIRKVNGASVLEIMIMLNLNFIKWMLLSFALATPIAYYGMNKWLNSFAYQTALNWVPFVISGFISLAIVLLTVSWLTYRAASRNPIKSLRYE